MRDLFRIQLAPTFSGVLCGTKKKENLAKTFFDFNKLCFIIRI